MATKTEKQLLEYFSALGKHEQESVLDFAEFLFEKERPSREAVVPPDPQITPRPEEESVVAAIKRLSASYSMLDKQHMLHEISGLMAQHMLQGRAASEVIDDIEVVFKRQYQQFSGKEADE